MANEFKIKHGFISTGDGSVEGSLTITGAAYADNGSRIASRPWVTQFLSDNSYATSSDITTAISNLVDSAPDTLDTLNELAAALGDDPNFSTTLTNSIATKLPLAGGTMSGNIRWTSTGKGLEWVMNTDGAGIKFYNTGDADTNSRLEYYTTDNGDEYHRFMVATNEEMTIKSDGVRVTNNIYMASNLVATQSWVSTRGYGAASDITAVNTRIDEEVLPLIDTKADAGHVHDYLPLAGGTIEGNLNLGDSSNITMAVGSPGQLRILGSGYTGSIALDATAMYIYHDSSLRNLVLGTNERARLTIDGESGNATFVGTISASGYNNTNWDTAYGWGDHSGLYDSAGAADDVNSRIDNEVIPSIPTNNNQLTNGAGYITDGNTGWNNSYGFITASSSITGNAASATSVVTLQDTAPDGVNGKLWWETDTGKLKVYYGDSSAWIDALPLPDTSLFYTRSGGAIDGDVYIGQILTVEGNITTSSSFVGPLEGNASTATQLATARNIALTGAVTGNANFDGSGNISISTTATSDPTLTINGDASGSATFTNLGNATLTLTISDDSHNHTIANVDGLQTALDGKQAAGSYLTSIPSSYATDAEVDSAISVVNDRIETEILPAIDDKLSITGGKITGILSHDNRAATNVAHWSAVGDSTGAIKITIPGSHSSGWSMLVLRITAYEYNSSNHTVYYVSGHDWTSGWYNNGVTKLGDSSKDISLGHDGNKDYVILGLTSASWTYGHVTVDVMSHPSFYSTSMDISSGWAVSQVTSLDGITVQSVTNRKVLTNVDEGSGNGIDADTVDGIQAASFLRSDANDTMSGVLTITGNNGVSKLRLEGTTPTIDLDDSDGDSFYIHVNSNQFYVLADRNGGGNYGDWETPHPLQLNAASNATYLWGNLVGNAAYASTSDFDAVGSADAVNTRINEEVLPLIDSKADSAHEHQYIRTVLSTQEADDAMPSTGYALQHFLGKGPSNNDGHILGMTWTGTSVYGAQIWVDTDPNNLMAFRSRSNAGVWTRWNNLWHDGNLSNVSQLTNDAGYITSFDITTQTDGKYLRSNADDSFSGNLTSAQSKWIKFYHPTQTDTNDGKIGAGVFDTGLNIVGAQTVAGTGRQVRIWGDLITSTGSKYATESYVNTAVSNLVDSAPAALDTLNELAAALGDDANFSTTIANNIGAVNTRIDEEVFPAIDAKQNAGNYATFTNNIYLNNSTTTASFITELANEHGAFQDDYKAYKVAWDYAGNSNLDVGFESVELAGCVVECWGGTYKHVRLTRPTTGTGGPSIYVYNDQGGSYAPGWRQIWTSDEFNSTNVSNWNTAYGWGDHAGAGYSNASNLSSGTVPYARTNKVLPTSGNYVWDASTLAGDYETGVQTSFVRAANGFPEYGAVLHIGARGGGDAGGDFQIYCGHGSGNGGNHLRFRNADNNADPTDSWTAFKTIWDSENLVNNQDNWNTAYGWGNHASAGYLKSIPSTYATDAEVNTAVSAVSNRIDTEVLPSIDSKLDAKDRTNYKGVTDDYVIGQMMWKNYGNNHTIFDASNSTTPGGTACSNSTPEVPWTGTYPTLMGWNGSSTYGVRVDSAGRADNANYAASAGSVVTIQDAAPTGVDGRLWWESDTGKLKVYYGSSSAWIDAVPIPDVSIYYPKSGGAITGDVLIEQTLTVVGNTLIEGTLTETSDINLKENIAPLENALGKVISLEGVSFNKKDTPEVKEIGFIAQQVEEIVPELVTETESGIKTVSYTRVSALLVETVKEQQKEIDSLKALVADLANKINNL